MGAPSDARPASRTAQKARLASDMVCGTCYGKTTWASPLVPNSHGCAECHKVFDQNHWRTHIVADHKRKIETSSVQTACTTAFQ